MKSHNWEWRREVGSSRHREEESSTGMERGLKRKEGDLDGGGGGGKRKERGGFELFKEEYFRSTVEQMLEDGLHSDITFESENDRTPAHRCILASVSPVYRAMFHNKMLEQTTSVVKVEDMSTGAFRCFLRLLYTGGLSREDIEKYGLEVLAACHKYEVPQLARVCSPMLGDMLTVENSLGILEHASLYDMSLLERCKEFIGSNLKKIVSNPGFEELAVRNPTLIVDLVRSTALDEKSRELRISFRSFSTTKVRNSTLRMPRECSVADLISELKQLMKLPSTRWLQIAGVVDHRIVRIYGSRDKIKDLTDDLKAEEIPSQKVKSTVKTLRLSHMLPDRTGKFYSYFGEPFTLRVPNDRFLLWQLKERISHFKSGMEFANFHFAKRSNLHPDAPFPEYLGDSSPVPLNEDDFLALVHPICPCSAQEIHSPFFHLS
ncbi:hypothetical protein R1flu_021011 [Riccia fluitans]|uniref:ubiquitinyl hydrolase 1 n=1 Tax=Riccia fluitans TaxID=41844 RepID=A0ABD1ZN53_9MARC